jgi:hypothetical protein
MVGNSPKEDVLTSCKATAMIYNDTQKKWIHCAPNGPAKIQLLFAPDTQSYRIVGRQIQDHEVVLNHSISKGLKYNQATPTFHQWRDQSCVYGLNFSSKLDAQEFGTTMLKILESVNGSTNLSSQTNANGGATLPSSTLNNNNNNNNSTTSSKRQTNQPSSSSLPPAATTVPINSISNSSSSSVSEPQQQQQQQQHSSSSYNNQSRPNSNPINSVPTSTGNNYYSQRHQPADEDETNYALISDSYSSYGDTSTNKNNNISQAPPLNSSMPTSGSTPPAAPPTPPPPPPPPLPNGFGSGPPPAPALVLPTANGNGGANTPRKTSTTTSAPPMDLMSEMAAKFAQRRKNIDEAEKSDSSNTANTNKATSKSATTTLPPTPAASVQTSPRVPRKSTDSQPTYCTLNDLEKVKADILSEIRKDIEKAKQEILTAIQDRQKPPIRR